MSLLPCISLGLTALHTQPRPKGHELVCTLEHAMCNAVLCKGQGAAVMTVCCCAEPFVRLPEVDEAVLHFAMVAATHDPEAPMGGNGVELSMLVGKSSKPKQSEQPLLGRYTHPGKRIKVVTLFNAVQQLGGAAQVCAANCLQFEFDGACCPRSNCAANGVRVCLVQDDVARTVSTLCLDAHMHL